MSTTEHNLSIVRRRHGPSPELQTAANEMGEALIALETGVEHNLRQSADLVLRVIDERKRQNLGVMYGQEIIDGALKVAGHTAKARSATIGLHGAMAATQRKLRVQAVMLNPGSKPDGNGMDGMMMPHGADEGIATVAA